MKKLVLLLLMLTLVNLSAQNIGINTTSPQAKLHIAGDFKFNPETTINATRLVGVTPSGGVREFALSDNFVIENGTLKINELIDENIFLVGDIDQSGTAPTTSDYNDYDLGLEGVNSDNTIIRVFGETAGYNVTGFVKSYNGRIFYYYNAQNNNMTFYDLDPRSEPENQIITSTGSNVGIAAEGVAEFIYDDILQKWILINVRN